MDSLRADLNRLIGPIKDHDYLSTEVPIDILYLIADELKAGSSASAYQSLNSLSRTSRSLHHIFMPILYQYNVRHKHDGKSALIWGAKNGILGTVKKALEAGEDVDYRDDGDQGMRRKRPPQFWLSEGPADQHLSPSACAIHFAVKFGYDDIVQFLLDKGASMTTPARELCTCPDIEMPGKDRGWNPYVGPRTYRDLGDGLGDGPDQRGWYPLHLALCQNRPSTAELLIKSGAPFYMETRHEREILRMKETVHENLELHNMCGAIHTAAAFGHHRLLRLMVHMAAVEAPGGWAREGIRTSQQSRDIVNRQGWAGYPLHYAASSEHSNVETILALIELGAEVDAIFDPDLSRSLASPRMGAEAEDHPPARTALGSAVIRSRWGAVYALIGLGASILGIRTSRFTHGGQTGDLENARLTVRSAIYPRISPVDVMSCDIDGGCVYIHVAKYAEKAQKEILGDAEECARNAEQRIQFIRQLVRANPKVDLDSPFSHNESSSDYCGLLQYAIRSFKSHWKTAGGLISLLIELGASPHGFATAAVFDTKPLSALIELFVQHTGIFDECMVEHLSPACNQMRRQVRESIMELVRHGAAVGAPKMFGEQYWPKSPSLSNLSPMDSIMVLFASPDPRMRAEALKLLRSLVRYRRIYTAAKGIDPDVRLESFVQKCNQEARRSMLLGESAQLYTIRDRHLWWNHTVKGGSFVFASLCHCVGRPDRGGRLCFSHHPAKPVGNGFLRLARYWKYRSEPVEGWVKASRG
ncbi:Ankyrin repeat-containing domain protein [Naviculisporaceae sp. PSN 640]